MLRRAALSAVAASSLLAASAAFAAPPKLPAPGNASAGADLDALRKGIVQVERGGRPIAVGTVLSKDGRVLTSLSGLGAATEPEIRYADGSTVKAKVGHKDKDWDLALLVPQSGHWLDGLTPTDADPTKATLSSFLPKAGKLAMLGIALKGRTDAKSKDGDPLKDVLDVDLKGIPGIPGAPILDDQGKVVGILVHACKDDGGSDKEKAEDKSASKGKGKGKGPSCSPTTVAAPVYALRSFLLKTPKTAAMPAPWLGLGGAPSAAGNVKGVRVVGVAAGSPAEKAGLKSGDDADTIVAVEGNPVETPEQLAEVIAKHAIGETVKFLVFSKGKFREAAVTLRPAP